MKEHTHQHRTHYGKSFKNFKMDHLNEHAMDVSRHSNNLTEHSEGHKQTLKNLTAMDARIRKQFPQFNVSLSDKFTAAHRTALVADGMGGHPVPKSWGIRSK